MTSEQKRKRYVCVAIPLEGEQLLSDVRKILYSNSIAPVSNGHAVLHAIKCLHSQLTAEAASEGDHDKQTKPDLHQ